MNDIPLGKPRQAILKSIATALLLGFVVYLCWTATLGSSGLLRWSPYGFSEWLINYEGGFVRRGLPGQLIHSLAGTGSALTTVNRLVFVNFSALCGLLFCLTVLSRPVTPLMSLLLLVVPGGVYGMMMGNEFYYRKEVVFHVGVAAVALLFLIARRSDKPNVSRFFDSLAVTLIAVESVVFPLGHEGFLFMSAMPLAVILYWIADQQSRRAARTTVVAYFGLLIVQFLVLAAFKGDSATARAIWASLNPADQRLISPDGTIKDAIDAIGMSLLIAIRLARTVMTSGYAWYWAFALAASAAYLIALGFASTRQRMEAHRRASWIFSLYVMCLVTSLPLFLLGFDWGRWIAGVNMSVAILICAGEFRNPVPVSVSLPFQTRDGEYSKKMTTAVLIVALLFGLSFKVPECCISGTGKPFDHVWHLK